VLFGPIALNCLQEYKKLLDIGEAEEVFGTFFYPNFLDDLGMLFKLGINDIEKFVLTLARNENILMLVFIWENC
jgi:hypothetical protein